MKSKLLLLFVFALHTLYAQNRAVISGRIVYNGSGVKDVLVVNNNAQAETRTDSLGYFTIKATTGDLFVISDYKVETKKIRYTPDQVKNNLFIINVVLLTTEIEEVVINRSNVTPESLGLVPENQVRYTVAERRLRAEFGSCFNLENYMALNAGDNMYKLPKRKSTLLQNVLTERKLMLIEQVSMLYTSEQLISLFKIPEGEIKYFMYYIAEDEDMAKAADTKNTTIIKFLLAGLAVKYNNITDNYE